MTEPTPQEQAPLTEAQRAARERRTEARRLAAQQERTEARQALARSERTALRRAQQSQVAAASSPLVEGGPDAAGGRPAAARTPSGAPTREAAADTRETAVEPGATTVVVHRVSMRYRVPRTATPRTGSLARRLRLNRPAMTTVKALSSVSFVARAGETIGLVGQNGSGKSTLMRIIAGLETATRGTVLASSTPSFLGVNAALLPDLSGLENVRLGLLAMGKRPDEVASAMADVLALADLGDAVSLPMRTYSSGMAARLRFAIAAAAQPEILLIDEALATGDAASKERSEERVAQIRERAGTVFLVSHAAQTIEQTCTRALWLHQGELIGDGPAEETARAYRWWAWNVAKGERDIADMLVAQARARYRETIVAPHDSETDRYLPRHGSI